MGKFSSAKCSGATDTKLQEAYNRLIDLLDRGQVFESLVNGRRVRIILDATGGFSGFIDGVQMFGLNPATGQYTIKKYEDLIASLGELAFLDVADVQNLYIQDTAPTVTHISMWLETAAGAPKSLWMVTP